MLGIGTARGATIRVGFSSNQILFVLVVAYAIALQARGSGANIRSRNLALVVMAAAAGLIFLSATRMTWLLTALAVLILLATARLRDQARYILLGGSIAAIAFIASTTEPKTTCVLLIFAGQTYGKLTGREWRRPGDGQWHEVQTTMQAPANAQESEFQVVLSHYNSPQAPALFDKVEVTIE